MSNKQRIEYMLNELKQQGGSSAKSRCSCASQHRAISSCVSSASMTALKMLFQKTSNRNQKCGPILRRGSFKLVWNFLTALDSAECWIKAKVFIKSIKQTYIHRYGVTPVHSTFHIILYGTFLVFSRFIHIAICQLLTVLNWWCWLTLVYSTSKLNRAKLTAMGTGQKTRAYICCRSDSV